jgi:hypothetical protein
MTPADPGKQPLDAVGPDSTVVWLRPEGPFPQDFGRYALRGYLGRGAMGTVYRAWDTRLEIDVALKVPRPEIIGVHGVLERFYREARAAARLCHPGLCQVYDIDQWGGHHYLTMRFIDGRPLTAQPRLDPRASAALVRRVALAMAEAHRLDVIHRDLKLSNILLTQDGEPVITDFGIALRLDAVEWQTEFGAAVGTLPYMAPEQLLGDREALGPGCDIYALGVIYYHLLTGHLPFTGRDRKALSRRIAEEPPVSPAQSRPDLDPRLETVCLKALAKASRDRFATMREFAEALEEPAGTPAPPVMAAPGRRPPVRPESIRFAFTGLGERAPRWSGPRDRLFLDVGNDLRPGVIDHHHLTAYAGSTAGLVLAHPALLDGAVVPTRRPDAPFTIVVHARPDLDCVASAYLATAYLAVQALPPGAEALARYVDLVDAGGPGFTLARPFTLYAAYQHLADRLGRRAWDSEAAQWQECVRQGLLLVGYVVGAVARGQALPDVDAFACPGLFGPADRDEVRRDVERYRRKLAEPRTQARVAVFHLPGRFGGVADVEALLVRDVQNAGEPDRCVFFKDWARSDAEHSSGGGFVALSVFHTEGPHQLRRCILSVRPDAGVTLRGLGAQVDDAEAARRRQVHGVDDRVTDPVTGEPKPARPGYGNADPWYDGRAHGFTIVDSPRSGTLLTADEIEEIFLRFGASAAQPLPQARVDVPHPQ